MKFYSILAYLNILLENFEEICCKRALFPVNLWRNIDVSSHPAVVQVCDQYQPIQVTSVTHGTCRERWFNTRA